MKLITRESCSYMADVDRSDRFAGQSQVWASYSLTLPERFREDNKWISSNCDINIYDKERIVMNSA